MAPVRRSCPIGTAEGHEVGSVLVLCLLPSLLYHHLISSNGFTNILDRLLP
jgi:hypothetical protein